MNPKSLLTGSLPQNRRAKDVQGSPRNHCLAVATDIRIRCIHTQNGIVFSNGGTEQQRAILSQLQRQPRQKSSVLIVQPEFAGPERVDIAESIEHGECISLFENPGANVDTG